MLPEGRHFAWGRNEQSRKARNISPGKGLYSYNPKALSLTLQKALPVESRETRKIKRR